MSGLWRQIAQAELRAESADPDELLLHPPEKKFKIDKFLLAECYRVWQMTGNVPHPYEILAMPRGYVDELYQFKRGVRYHKDYDRRPDDMK